MIAMLTPAKTPTLAFFAFTIIVSSFKSGCLAVDDDLGNRASSSSWWTSFIDSASRFHRDSLSDADEDRFNVGDATGTGQDPAQPEVVSESEVAGLDLDPILKEIMDPATGAYNHSAWPYSPAAEDFERAKRGAIQLAQMMKCATGCDPLAFQGYGCYCGFLGAGTPVDDIDMCCKMHDWCYTTSTCESLSYHLPYFVPFKWKCNGGAPYCIPGKTKDTDRTSCSHQLCECDREFTMCLQKHLPCPTSRAMCGEVPHRLVQNVAMGMATGHGMHHSHAKPTYNPASNEVPDISKKDGPKSPRGLLGLFHLG